jgi:hypothetical protein
MGDIEDKFLVRSREFGVRRNRKLTRSFDRGRATPKIEQ